MSCSRRNFLAGSVTSLAAGSFKLRGDPLGLPIGCQVYPVRAALSQDLDGTLQQLAAIGFQTIEMCSPVGYGRSSFGPLVDLKASELRERIHAAGLRCESCHYVFPEMKDKLDDRIAFAKELGLKQMVLSGYGLRPASTMDDWMRAADATNKIAERVNQAGLLFAYHNHGIEFRQLDGVLIYDRLMSTFDPKLVRLQFQVSVINLGYEAATYLTQYPGRFLSLHLQDWSTAENKQVPMGKGIIDWQKLFMAAKKSALKNYFVEMDLDNMKASIPYLHSLT